MEVGVVLVEHGWHDAATRGGLSAMSRSGRSGRSSGSSGSGGSGGSGQEGVGVGSETGLVGERMVVGLLRVAGRVGGVELVGVTSVL